MANSTFLRCRANAKLLRLKSIPFIKWSSTGGISTYDKHLEETDIEEIWADEAKKDYLKQIQNVSGLPPNMYRKLHGEVASPHFKDCQKPQNLCITYGSKSGEDPRLLWPSRQEIAKMHEEEEEEEVSLMGKIQLGRQEKEDAFKAKNERRKMIEQNMTRMNKWILEYHKKVKAADFEILKRKEKQEALLAEARDYFGYHISTKDPKFEQMVEEKQERERKEAKEQKKRDKANKLAERLKQDMTAMKMASSKETKEEEEK